MNQALPTAGNGTDGSPARTDFLVVGLGASAGGIQALREFFAHVPAGSGVAYVVILHLSPDHDSRLAEVLQAVSSIPITQVREKVRVEPNHVYVVPPNQHLEMQDDFIVVSPNTLVEERRAPIDIFFRTLAESHRERAVCVILSGTGANGSMGLKRIKECGGVAFVQNPREAEFNEMPRNAIATNLVDAVLPVADIPAKIIAYQERLGGVEIPAEAEARLDDQQQALREVFTQLRVRTGHDFSNYKRATLLRRIERRINIHHLPDLTSYTTLLRENPDETPALLKDLLISVTNFFRDSKAFEAVEREILPSLFRGKTSKDQVRIWVVGCATGEEAYSLAMLCAERTFGGVNAPKVQIFATDIDEAAIASAREGLYTINDAADVSPERLRRFFTKEGRDYRIRREIREMVLFAHQNVLKDPPFSQLDLVSCRNLLIYLNSEAQERIMETFHFALKPGGYLFLGSSESTDGAGDLFAAVSKEHHLFRSRQTGTRQLPIPEPTSRFRFGLMPPPQPPPEAEQQALERLSYGELHQQLLEAYAPPSVVVNEEYDILHLSERAGRYLQITGGEPSLNLLKVVREELRLELRTALFQAVQRQTNVTARGLKLQVEGRAETLNLHVRPVLRQHDPARGFLLVLFEQAEETAATAAAVFTSSEPVAQQLEEELLRAKTRLRVAVEQYEVQTEELKASNEELQAMNEELLSAAEELETSKEELQAMNEELRTVNQELKIKIEELSLSNSNMQNLINSTDIATIFLDRSLRVRLFTPAASSIFNLLPADFGRPLSDITHRLTDAALLADAESVLDTLKTIEDEVQTDDGRIFWMRVLPYRTAEDRINGVVITFVDITQRKQAEEGLREARTYLEFVLEAAETGVWEVDLATQVAKTSLIHNRIFGYSQPVKVWNPEILRQHIVAEDQPKFEQGFARALETGVFELQVRVRWPDGSIHWIYDRGKVIYDAQQRPLRIAGVTLDITPLKEAEEALRESEERHRLTINSVTDYAIFTMDTAGLIRTWNVGAENIFGYTAAEAVGQPSELIFTPEDKAAGAPQEELRQAREQGRAADERWHLRKDGTRFYVSGVVAPLRDAARLTGYVKIARDLTERKAQQDFLEERVRERTRELAATIELLQKEIAERKAAEAQRAGLMRHLVTMLEDERRRIAREMHDQFGQLLTALILKLGLLKNDCGQHPEQREQIEVLEQVARQLDKEVDFLVWELRPTALDDLGLQMALTNYAQTWSKHYGIPVQLHTSGLENKRLTFEIETALYRIAQEALNNIAKHAKASTVNILLEGRQGAVSLILEDDGQGFEETTLTDASDRGLGLAGMRERATLLGGSFEIESQPGQGTTVLVQIPVTPTVPEANYLKGETDE